MSGPQIRLCLFTFRTIASKYLSSLTSIDTLSWLGGAVVTPPLWMQEVSSSNPGYSKGFYVWLFCFVVVFFIFCSKAHNLSHNFAIPFVMLIYLVYLTYCKICDWLYGYKDTDLASLKCLNATLLKTIKICYPNI